MKSVKSVSGDLGHARTGWFGFLALLALGSVDLVAMAEPAHFSFEVQGQVRAAKSQCLASSCTTYLLVDPRNPEERRSQRGTRQSDSVARRSEAEPDPTLELWRLDMPSGTAEFAPSMRRLRTAVPYDAGRMAFCARDSSGSESLDLLMVQAGGSVHFVEPASDDRVLGSGTRVGSDTWSAPATPWNRNCSELLLVGPGEARIVRLAGLGSRRSVLSAQEFPLPLGIRRNYSGLTLESPRVQRLDEDNDLIVVGPRSYDDIRLESLVFEPSQDAAHWLSNIAASEVIDGEEQGDNGAVLLAWSRLPGQEEIIRSRYLSLDQKPILEVVTQEAGKLGILERKKLRLFHLEADRTRAGKAPFFQVLTSSRLWQRLDVQFLDATGDGIDDLVLVQPEGLSGEPTLVDVYAATAPLSFSSRKQRIVLETGQVRWSLGQDWNGDGLRDFMVLDGPIVQFHYAKAPQQEGDRRQRRKRTPFWSEQASSRLRLGSPKSNEESVLPGSAQSVWEDDRVVVVPLGARGGDDDTGEVSVMVETEGEEALAALDQTSTLVHILIAPAVLKGDRVAGEPQGRSGSNAPRENR